MRKRTVAIEALLVASLKAWGLSGRVAADGDGCLLHGPAGVSVRITALPEGGWEIEWRDGGPVGLPPIDIQPGLQGLLRALREGMDPGWQPRRLLVAPAPPMQGVPTGDGA